MAIATFILALKTRSVAKETRELGRLALRQAEAVEQQAEHIERQVAISAQALSTSVQPWLVWEPSFEVPSGVGRGAVRHGEMYIAGPHPCLRVSEQGDGSVKGWFTVRNVGNGIAILDMSESHIYPRNGPDAFEGVHPSVASPVVPPGETADVEFTVPPSQSPDKEKMTLLQLTGGAGDELFAVELAYADSFGNVKTRAKFHAHRNEPKKRPWSVYKVEYSLPNGQTVRARRFG
jgi:hypothetical protein